MSELFLRPMKPDEWGEVARLIHTSTNAWYQAQGKPAVFGGEPEVCEIYCRTYEALDPGCCLVAVELTTGCLAGSCFYHPRSTHISIGIVNVHPDYFGQGVGRRLLEQVIALGESENKPLRLVSSAQNLDSFSLYTRAGFVPRMAFQDMYLAVGENGLAVPPPPIAGAVRPGTPEDAGKMAALEYRLTGIEREGDYCYFLENGEGIWSVNVLEGERGELDGFLVAVNHPATCMLGPGIMRTEQGAIALVYTGLNQFRGRTPVFLPPVEASELVRQLYSWGARNCEIHFAQVRGAYRKPEGVLMPTFLPETG